MQLEPLRLFEHHLSSSHGMATCQNAEDLQREMAIRYPRMKVGVEQEFNSDVELRNRAIFAPMWSEWGEHNYRHNQLGFRDHELELDVDTCYYGCSQTYAMGVPLKARFSARLDQAREETSNNFGNPGTSSEECLLMFMATSNFIRMRRAVFMLPDIMRQTAPFMDDTGKGDVRYYNLMYTRHYLEDDHYTLHRDTIGQAYDAFHRLPPDYAYDRLRNLVQQIAYIGQLKNIEIVIGSWSRYTYSPLMSFNRYPGTQWRLPRYINPLTDRARDEVHFGPITHGLIAEAIEEVLA